jgi:Flp pilus assembly protein TadB
MKIDYYQYRLTIKEMIRFWSEGLGICIVVNFLCYRLLWVFVITVPFTIFYLKLKKQTLIQKRRERLRGQFKDAIHALRISINAGYSMENAIGACLKDLRSIYDQQEPIIQEFLYIQKQMSFSVSIEALFMDLGNRSQLEDIQNFAEIYAMASKSGGNLNAILGKTTKMIEEKIETGKEITASIAAKRVEQTIMSIVPCGIILYVQLTSPGFMDVLYGNMVGIVVMTGCLILYLLAFWLGKTMIEIEV